MARIVEVSPMTLDHFIRTVSSNCKRPTIAGIYVQ